MGAASSCRRVIVRGFSSSCGGGLGDHGNNNNNNNSNRNGAGSNGMVLESSTEAVAFSPAGFVNAKRRKFVPEVMRFREFTEEKVRFRIPHSSRYERVRAIQCVGNDICTLSTQPLSLNVVNAERWTYCTLSLDRIVPFLPSKPLMGKMNSIGDEAGKKTSSDASILVYLPTSCDLIRIPPGGGDCSVLRLPKLEDTVESSGFLASSWSAVRDLSNKQGEPFMVDASSSEDAALIFGKEGARKFTVLRGGSSGLSVSSVCLPEDIKVERIDALSPQLFALKTAGGAMMWIRASDDHREYFIHSIERSLHDARADNAFARSMHLPGIYDHDVAYYQQLAGASTPGINEIFSSMREGSAALGKNVLSLPLRSSDSLMIVREDPPRSSIEVIAPEESKSRFVDVRPVSLLDELKWVDASELANGDVCTLQLSANSSDQREAVVRIWEVDEHALQVSMKNWRKMMGWSKRSTQMQMTGGGGMNQANLTSANPPEIDAPKHGKEDPNNDPHVGGNTWAGGTGGSNTAGLGGRGGPYRLDKGHQVHQVSEAAKAEVDEETKAKARAMAEKAFQERLREIDMGDDENDMYTSLYSKVQDEIEQMRVVLDALEARAKERVWLKHQSYGDFDDAKLVDGMTGERLVFKRRGNEEKAPGAPQDLPKRITFVVDCSGSMYRFNSQDARLERELQFVLMVMESFQGFESRIEYSIVGHSGEDEAIELVDFGKPPANEKERLKVLLRIVAHSQFCMSGDTTLEAAESAIESISHMESDDNIVFLLSDANLRRYGIQPSELGSVLLKDEGVFAAAVFLASFGQEALHIQEELPVGRGIVCFDSSELPKIFRQVFTSRIDLSM